MGSTTDTRRVECRKIQENTRFSEIYKSFQELQRGVACHRTLSVPPLSLENMFSMHKKQKRTKKTKTILLNQKIMVFQSNGEVRHISEGPMRVQ